MAALLRSRRTLLSAVSVGGALTYLANDVDSAIARSLRVARHALIVGLDYKFGPASKLPADTEAYKAAMAETHQRSAERMLGVCLLHGGLYVKLGQFISSMNFVLPPAYPTVMSACQDRATTVDFDTVRTAIEHELGCCLEDKFQSFEHEPVAAASLAQVHKAVTLKGQRLVAVKVQYPQLPSQIEADMRTMRLLAQATALIFPEHEYNWLLPEFESSMRKELDFLREAANASRTRHHFRDEPRVYVPEVLPELTTSRILTMEWVDGVKISDRARIESELGLSSSELAFLVSEAFSAMIFRHGFVHCDPHPGNLLARSMASSSTVAAANGEPGLISGWVRGRPRVQPAQLVLLDHGMYRELSETFRTSYSRLWSALLTGDHSTGRAAAAALGVPESDYDALSLVLTFRPAKSSAAIGSRLSHEDRQRLRTKYGKVGANEVNGES